MNREMRMCVSCKCRKTFEEEAKVEEYSFSFSTKNPSVALFAFVIHSTEMLEKFNFTVKKFICTVWKTFSGYIDDEAIGVLTDTLTNYTIAFIYAISRTCTH